MKPILRFLISGDFQCHNWKQFSYIRADGTNSRLANILSVFDRMTNYAVAHGVDKILLNGDIFEESDYHPTDVFNAVYMKVAEMRKAGIRVVFNLGNHDITRVQKYEIVPIHTLVPFMHVARVIEWPSVLWENLFVVPYMPAEKVKEAIRSKKTWPHSLVLIFHGGVQGAKTGPNQYLVRNKLKLKDLRPNRFKLVLLSDYHTSQHLAENVLYLGSPIQHSFGETHSPGFWDVTLYDKEPWYHLVKVKTNLPRFIQTEISEMGELRSEKEKLKGNYVQVSITSKDVSTEEVEDFAKKVPFSVRIVHSEEAEGSDAKRASVRSISPQEHIRSFVRRSVGRGHRASLIKLGQDLYEGKEETNSGENK